MVEGKANYMSFQQAYVLLQIMIFQMEGRYSGLIYQNSLANILNLPQRFIKFLHQQTKPHKLVGQFPNKQKGNKETYDSIDDFLHMLKDYIGEPIATRYVRDITGMITRDNNNKKVFFPHHRSKYQYYEPWCFEHGYLVTKKYLGMTNHTTST